METSMADQSAGAPVGSITAKGSEQKEDAMEGSTAAICLFTFVGTAAATLIVCGLTPARRIPEEWHRLIGERTRPEDKGKAKGASAASGLSPL